MGIIASSVFAGSIAFGAVFLMVFFFRKKRIAAINNDGENGRMIIDSSRMNDSLPLTTNGGGGGGEGSTIFWRIIWFSGEQRGDQSLLAEYKEGAIEIIN